MKITPEQVDRWRIIPRLMVFWYAMLVWYIVDWFMWVDKPTTEQTLFATTVVGLSTAIFGFYVNSGPKSYNKDYLKEEK